ncbi:hypothetical protein [Pikeienuella sp. HZG-20]|uniref:hypothetical protein n=1 Tax=Paludibacillus litoralis TaxID=3133267 RepID=UPI0030ED4E81
MCRRIWPDGARLIWPGGAPLLGRRFGDRPGAGQGVLLIGEEGEFGFEPGEERQRPLLSIGEEHGDAIPGVGEPFDPGLVGGGRRRHALTPSAAGKAGAVPGVKRGDRRHHRVSGSGNASAKVVAPA